MTTRAKTASAQDLPGLEDRALRPLEAIATEYADVRDRRMQLNAEEADLKARAMALMKKHNKTTYRRDGIEINLVPGEETIKVKISKKDPAAADAEA